MTARTQKEKHPRFKLDAWLQSEEAKRLFTPQRLLVHAIGSHLNAEGVAWPGEKVLAVDLNLSLRRTAEVVEELRESGISPFETGAVPFRTNSDGSARATGNFCQGVNGGKGRCSAYRVKSHVMALSGAAHRVRDLASYPQEEAPIAGGSSHDSRRVGADSLRVSADRLHLTVPESAIDASGSPIVAREEQESSSKKSSSSSLTRLQRVAIEHCRLALTKRSITEAAKHKLRDQATAWLSTREITEADINRLRNARKLALSESFFAAKFAESKAAGLKYLLLHAKTHAEILDQPSAPDSWEAYGDMLGWQQHREQAEQRIDVPPWVERPQPEAPAPELKPEGLLLPGSFKPTGKRIEDMTPEESAAHEAEMDRLFGGEEAANRAYGEGTVA